MTLKHPYVCLARLRSFLGLVFFLAVFGPFHQAAQADELGDRLHYWRGEAFHCTATGTPFPSKEARPGASGTECDDGDMTLFNGLLCATGEEEGCTAVKGAQGPDGRWWRSPRRIGMDRSTGNDVSFSEDQALGVMLYLLHSGDEAAFDRWAAWIAGHRPCIVKVAGACLIPGWPRFCSDDNDNRCAFRPMNCVVFDALATKFGEPAIRPPGIGCDLVMGVTFAQADPLKNLLPDLAGFIDVLLPCVVQGHGDLRDALGNMPSVDLVDVLAHIADDSGFGHSAGYPVSAQLREEADKTCPGFPLHKVAVRLLVMDMISARDTPSEEAADLLAAKEAGNPFFLLLADETASDRSKVVDVLLKYCPASDRPSGYRFQWTWERTTSADSWKESMYWECIFMAKLLGYQ